MFTTDIQAARGTSLFDFPAPAGRVVGEAFDSAIETNPVPLFMQSIELHEAKQTGFRLPKDRALEEARRAGVAVTVPDDGITEPALKILIERRKDDAARQLIFARSPGGVATAGVFGAGVAGAFMDPLNLAAGFIPVLGGTRYAAKLAEAGTAGARAGLRLGVGAAEGAVGAAAVELPTAALHRDLQDDYSLYDSLANVAFGTFASAGIRGISGAARDAWLGMAKARELDALRGVDPQVWASAKAAAATAEERAFWTDLEAGFQRGEGIPDGMRAAFDRERFQGEFDDALAEHRAALARIAADADVAIDRRFQREREKMLAAGIEPDEALKQAFAKVYPETERRLKSAAEIGVERMGAMELDDARKAIAEGRGLIQVPQTNAEILAAIEDSTHAHALKAAVAQAIEGKQVDVTPVLRQDKAFGPSRLDLSEAREWAKRQNTPEAFVGADRAASERATETIKAKGETKAQKPETKPAASETPKSPELAEAEGLLDEARTRWEEATVDAADLLDRARHHEELLAELEWMRSQTGNAQRGGHLLREYSPDGFGAGEVVGRTTWIPNAEWWPGRPKGLTERQIRDAIDKLLAGEPLTRRERQMVTYLMDVAEETLRSRKFAPKPDELLAEGLGKADVFDAALVARAAAIDEDRVAALAIKYEHDDAAFMRRIKEILDEDARAKAGEPGEAGERAPREGAEGERAAAREEETPEEVKQVSRYEDAFRALGDCAGKGGL